ncbi:hypothetical protein BH18ACT17_BH18ACT17_01660 [soil metagenome]
MTVSAVNPFAPLASANRVSIELAMPCARSASPKAFANSVVSPRSTRTTPQNPVSVASEKIGSSDGCIARTYQRPGGGLRW